MAAGLGFKTFVTGEVLTAADTNGYLMQGVLVFADSTARDAAITSPQEGQVCYLKSDDAIYTYSGTAWAPFSSGAFTLLSTSNWTNAGAGTVTVSSISQSYKHLFVIAKSFNPSSATSSIDVSPNAASTSQSICAYSTAASTAAALSASGASAFKVYPAAIASSNSNHAFALWIYNYSSTTNYKPMSSSAIVTNGSSVAVSASTNGGFYSNNAVTSIQFNASGANSISGTNSILIYGVN